MNVENFLDAIEVIVNKRVEENNSFLELLQEIMTVLSCLIHSLKKFRFHQKGKNVC